MSTETPTVDPSKISGSGTGLVPHGFDGSRPMKDAAACLEGVDRHQRAWRLCVRHALGRASRAAFTPTLSPRCRPRSAAR